MTLEQIRENPIAATSEIAKAMQDPPAHAYILHCLDCFFTGNYGAMPAEDTEANNRELQAGTGRIIARYKAAEGLREDVYIIAYFSDTEQGNDYNYTTVMYTGEY